MKNTVLIASLFALSFATGFTCSKNAPEQTAQPAAQEAPAAQAQMAAAPASGDVAPAAPASADAAPAQPATAAPTH